MRPIKINFNSSSSLKRDNEIYNNRFQINFKLKYCRKLSTFKFMQSIIEQLISYGKLRTAETYMSTLRSFLNYRNEQDISLNTITTDIINGYEQYLIHKHLSRNTISFYMRILRAVYNRAVEKELIQPRKLFSKVFTGNVNTKKRAISLDHIRTIRDCDLSHNTQLSITRDLFMFSFYTRGMSFIDMAYLTKSNIHDGYLIYHRRKTHQQLTIKLEKCITEIIDRHYSTESIYLLPIINSSSMIDARQQYLKSIRSVNHNLHKLAHILDLPINLTTYVARHSWASIAHSKNIPISVISECMGHDNESTTRIYLASLDTTTLDQANHLILNSL